MEKSEPTKGVGLVDEKKYFEKVLDDVVSLNSLFTVAVFIGLSFAQPGKVQSLDDNPSCDPDAGIRKGVVALEIGSFSCFIFAGLLAKTVKVFLYTSEKQAALEREREESKGQKNGSPDNGEKKAHRNWKSLVGFYLSIYGTMAGCLLLLLAMVNVVQIKLGRLSCHSKLTVITVFVMVGIISLSLLIYFIAVTYGVTIAAQEIRNNSERKKEEKITQRSPEA